MKNHIQLALVAFAAFAMLLGHAAVTKGDVDYTRASGPGLSCAQPNRFSARSDPLSCTNHYEFSGYCTQGAEGAGGNPNAAVAAGRAVYTVTSDWNGLSQEVVERFSISGLYYVGSYFAGASRGGGKVVLHCPEDPWIHSVSCKSGPIRWSGKQSQNLKDSQNGLNGVFPLASGHVNQAALRKQLLANSTGPRIVSPKEYEKFNNPKQLLVEIKAALPCGMDLATSAVLMIQKEKDIPTKAKGWVSETWVDAGTQEVKIRSNFGIAKLAKLTAGTWRVKARVISPNLGTPSLWRTFSVKRTPRIHISKSIMSSLPVVESMGGSITKPPVVQTPGQNQLFVNRGVLFQVSQTSKHPDYSRWEYVFEWQRADYHTKANNAYAKQKWEKWKKTSHSNEGYFPPLSGLVPPLQPWLSPVRLQTMAEGGTAHMNFSALRSHRPDSSYLYQFRVREHLRNSNTYGPWSAWRSFIVQEPYQVNVRPFTGSLRQKQGKQQSGQQQRRRFAPMAPVRRLSRPVQRLPKSKPTAGPRHATQQLGVRKKLTPAAPTLRFVPVAPVRRLSRPVQRLPKSKPTAGPRHATQQRGVRKKLTPAAPALRFAPAAPVRRLNLPARPGLNR